MEMMSDCRSLSSGFNRTSLVKVRLHNLPTNQHRYTPAPRYRYIGTHPHPVTIVGNMEVNTNADDKNSPKSKWCRWGT